MEIEIIAPSIVKQKIDQKARGEYYDWIQELPLGGALKIHPSMWYRRESVQHFFLTRFPKQLSVKKMLDGCYYVIKVA